MIHYQPNNFGARLDGTTNGAFIGPYTPERWSHIIIHFGALPWAAAAAAAAGPLIKRIRGRRDSSRDLSSQRHDDDRCGEEQQT